MFRNEQAIMSRGMDCLTKNLGFAEAELFIFNLTKEFFDYTEWRKEFFESAYSSESSQLKTFVDNAAEHFPKESFGL